MKLLILILILSISINLAYANPVAIWHFNEGSGNTAFDSSGFNNTGIISGAIWTAGISGSALQFDGINDYVMVNDSNILDVNFTMIDAWIKINNLSLNSATDQIIAKNSQYQFGVGDTIYPGNLIFSFGGMSGGNCDSTGWCNGGGPLTLNEWHHVAISFNGTTIRTYIDGEIASEWYKVFTMQNTANNLTIGALTTSGGNFIDYFDGKIDEIRINNQAIPFFSINAPQEAHLGETINITLSDLIGSDLQYIIAYSSSISPGLTLSDGRTIPLTPNGIFLGSVFYPAQFGLSNSQAFLNNGEGQATWTVPNVPFIAYFTVYFAAVAIDVNTQEIVQISNVKAMTLLP